MNEYFKQNQEYYIQKINTYINKENTEKNTCAYGLHVSIHYHSIINYFDVVKTKLNI